MLNTPFVQKVYLAIESTDMRKSINGLAAIVQESFSLDPFSTCLFVFCNKSRNKIKLLQWEHNGLAVWQFQ
jgi:transposase